MESTECKVNNVSKVNNSQASNNKKGFRDPPPHSSKRHFRDEDNGCVEAQVPHAPQKKQMD
jgi:hypothetical protein